MDSAGASFLVFFRSLREMPSSFSGAVSCARSGEASKAAAAKTKKI